MPFAKLKLFVHYVLKNWPTLIRITDAYTEQPKFVYNSYCIGQFSLY